MSTKQTSVSREIDLPLIEGRQCVPVRLLPYLTNWCPLSPDRIAELLGAGDPLRGVRWRIDAYQLGNGGSYMRVLPGYWASLSSKLEILAIELRRREEFEGQTLEDWEHRSIELLPAACFLWRDELEHEYGRTFEKQDFVRLRPGTRLRTESEANAETDALIHSDDPAEIERIQQRALEDTIRLDGDGTLYFSPVMTEKERLQVFEGFQFEGGVACPGESDRTCKERANPSQSPAAPEPAAAFGIAVLHGADASAPQPLDRATTTGGGGMPEPPPDRGRRMKRAALIAGNRRRWPSIERDLKDAASNGLSKAARDDTAVGWWWEGLAVNWAQARAKLQDVAPGVAGTVHRIQR